jgi:hypothetical protein
MINISNWYHSLDTDKKRKVREALIPYVAKRTFYGWLSEGVSEGSKALPEIKKLMKSW